MRIVERAEGFDDSEGDKCSWWELYISVGNRTYYARRYLDEVGEVTFMWFSDPRVDTEDRRHPFWPNDPDGDRREPFRGGVIPYNDTLFQAAVREVLTLPAVTRVEVSTSNESGRPARVDLVRLLGEG